MHYDEKYFSWQKKAGETGAELDIWKFQSFVKPSDRVLDFGCGGGYLLAKLNARERFGVEINPHARNECHKNGVTVFEKISDIPTDVMFDVIISNHALEHVEDPTSVLKQLYAKLVPQGKIIFVVPFEHPRKKFNPHDVDQHLFGWTRLLLGSLFTFSGFTVEKSEFLRHAWIPYSRVVYPLVPRWFFNILCTLWSILKSERQLRIIASRE